MKDKAATIASISKAMYDMHALSYGTFVSVKDKPITEIFRAYGVAKYATESIEVLKGKFIEVEGVRAGMMYRFIGEVVPDFTDYAKQAYELSMKKAEDYRLRVKSDTNQVKTKRSSLTDFDNKTDARSKKVRKVNLPQLRDLRYIIRESIVVQCMIVGIQLSEDNEEITEYRVRYCASNSLSYMHSILKLSMLFESAQEAANFMAVNVRVFEPIKSIV